MFTHNNLYFKKSTRDYKFTAFIENEFIALYEELVLYLFVCFVFLCKRHIKNMYVILSFRGFLILTAACQ